MLLPAAAAADVTPVPTPAPLDPQHWQDQQTMTWNDYKPIPGHNWATDGDQPSARKVTIALVAFDFPDQPFVITEPKGSDPFGNPQINPIARADVPNFYKDFFNTPSPLNHYQTINGYWMEQSGGKIGITDVKTYGPYRMPKKLSQYGLNDIGQNHGTTGNGCPGATTVAGANTNATTVAVADSSVFYVGDVITFGTGTTTRTITAIPDATHVVISGAVTAADGSAVQDCLNTNFNRDAQTVWQNESGCNPSTNCGQTIHLFVYAGYDETSVWQEFGEMMFQNKEDIPRETWGNPNPAKPNWVISRYVDWTSWFAGEQQWGESSIRQGESSGTITHEISHNIFSVGDNNNNPYVTPYHRVGSGTWDMMDRGSFNGPGGPHNRWEVPAQYGASMGAEHTLRSKIGMGFVDPKNVLRLNRNGLAQSGLAVTDVIARAVNTDPKDVNSSVRAGVQVNLDGAAPVDHEPACDVNTNPTCDGGGPNGAWTNYTLETVQRIGYGSFEPDNGVLIAKNKKWDPGVRGTEGSQCGYNCFTWVIDAHPEDMNMVDYLKPDGTPVMRTIADYRQLNDALFHAGTNSGSKDEYVDEANGLHFYVIDTYKDAKGLLHYKLGIQNPAGAGPQTRGVAVADAPAQTLSSTYTNCEFSLTNTGADTPTDPALHPQDETASFDSDIYRLSASASGSGWTAALQNELATAKFGESVTVPVYVTRDAAAAPNATVTLTAKSVSDETKTATATCSLAAPSTPVSGTVPPTLSLTLGAPASFGAFTPGVAGDYTAQTSANVVSTAGDATLTVGDPGHLSNGSFSLPEPLQVQTTPSSWTGPISNGPVDITFKQHIGANDALRTGTYSKTVTFTLSTTSP
ncbi:hypothetical protein [Candidatus Solirubrobacter pratensis]|uniref:hypothetical protein n=1 Tax=Candidatus Solirubrobacter pratensis TaxID=1298857 RepID=UPI0006879D6C|nr:hypothetical protein [Candidatus Solirubrobacter pratensis]